MIIDIWKLYTNLDFFQLLFVPIHCTGDEGGRKYF